ncbi:MAG: hypothetical protein IJD58_02585 [Lachnospiraceae bacterium]|nr:hypothetical protein [Lachnospiraceae bacterium]
MDKKKFNISNYFNGKLFIEAFKQVRVVGLTAFICLNALAIFLPVLNYMEMKEEMEHYAYQILFETTTIMLPLVATIFIITPIMYLMLFSFLTKRSGSDFYHSLPVKRTCMFVSFIIAIISWLLIITFSYTLLSIASANICYSKFIIDYTAITNYTINIFISCIAILGIFSIGTALTGTITSNIIFSCGLLVFPRLIINTLTNLLINNSITLTPNSGHFIFDNLINIPYSFLTVLFEGSYNVVSRLVIIEKHSLYTLLLGIIYLIIGMKLFASRPSEASSKSFRNNKIFSVLRLGTGFVLSLLIITTIYPLIYEEQFYDCIMDEKVPLLLVLLAIVLSMFAFEAANKRSIKNGLKAILFTPLIILVDIAIMFCLHGITKNYNNEIIDKKNVDYVYVGDLFSSYLNLTDEYSYDFTSYCNGNIAKTKITDDYIIDYLLNIYNSDRVTNFNAPSYYTFCEVEITFDSTIADKTRYVYLTSNEIMHLGEKLIQNEDIINCFYQFPDSDKSLIACPTSPENSALFYNTLISELKNLPLDILIEEYCSYEYSENYDSSGYIIISTFVNGYPEDFTLNVTSLTPKTYTMLINYSNEEIKDTTIDFLDMTKEDFSIPSINLYCDIYNVLPDGTSDIEYSYNINDIYSQKKETISMVLSLMSDAIKNNYVFDEENIHNDNILICKIYYSYLDTYGSYYIPLSVNSPLLEFIENIPDSDETEEY